MAKEERKSWSLVVTGEGREGEGFLGMLGQRRLMPGWVDDTVRRQDGTGRLGRRDIIRQEDRVGRVQ